MVNNNCGIPVVPNFAKHCSNQWWANQIMIWVEIVILRFFKSFMIWSDLILSFKKMWRFDLIWFWNSSDLSWKWNHFEIILKIVWLAFLFIWSLDLYFCCFWNFVIMTILFFEHFWSLKFWYFLYICDFILGLFLNFCDFLFVVL